VRRRASLQFVELRTLNQGSVHRNLGDIRRDVGAIDPIARIRQSVACNREWGREVAFSQKLLFPARTQRLEADQLRVDTRPGGNPR
jgi:hypothetical protein